MPLAVIRWEQRAGRVSGGGARSMPVAQARDAVNRLNAAYPALVHWVELADAVRPPVSPPLSPVFGAPAV